MDIKAKITELVEKIKADSSLTAKFQKDPVGTVKGLLGGIDLPTEQLEKIVDGIKAKISLDKLGDLGNALGGLLGKK